MGKRNDFNAEEFIGDFMPSVAGKDVPAKNDKEDEAKKAKPKKQVNKKPPASTVEKTDKPRMVKKFFDIREDQADALAIAKIRGRGTADNSEAAIMRNALDLYLKEKGFL